MPRWTYDMIRHGISKLVNDEIRKICNLMDHIEKLADPLVIS